MKKWSWAACAAVMVFALSACNSTDYKKTKEGYPYKIFSGGKNEKIVAGNVVKFHVTEKISDSVLFTSWGSDAKFVPIPKTGPAEQLAALLLQANNGDSILVLQPIDSILKNPQAQKDSFLLKNKGGQLRTIFHIVAVYANDSIAQAIVKKEREEAFYNAPEVKAQKLKDDEALKAYFQANSISATAPGKGTYVQTLTPGTGVKAKDGQFMLVRYTGKTLAGVQFDSNNKPGAELLPVQIGAGGTIPGFEDGLRQLSKGQKALLYLPSVMAYGPQGNPQAGIQPNENLVFEIDVVDITNTAPAPAMPQAMPDTAPRRK